MNPAEPYELDERQLQLALDVLRREQDAGALSRSQRVCYRLLQVFAYGSFVLWVAAFTALAFSVGGSIQSASVEPPSGWFLSAYIWSTSAALILGFLALVMLPMNLPLLFKSLRRERVVRKLGLSNMLRDPWKVLRRKRRVVNLLTGLVALVSAVFVLLVAIGTFLSLRATNEPYSRPLVLLSLAAVIVLFGLPVLVYFMRRRHERHKFLTDLHQIEQSLLRYREAAVSSAVPRFSVPATEMERIAAIERAQIATERAESIQSFRRKETSSYKLVPSREFRETRSGLDLSTNSRIDVAIEGLTDDPQPAAAQRDPTADTWLLNVPETDRVIEYAIDSNRHAVRLFAVRPAGETKHPSNKVGKDASDATTST